MIIFTMQNVAWQNYYSSLVNRNIDNKALYVYINIRMNKWYQTKINIAFSKNYILLLQTEKKCIPHKYEIIYKSTKHVEGSDL